MTPGRVGANLGGTGGAAIASVRELEGKTKVEWRANGAGGADGTEPRGGATSAEPRAGDSGGPDGRHTRADGPTGGHSTEAERSTEPPSGATPDGPRAADSGDGDGGQATGADGSTIGEVNETRRRADGRTGTGRADGAEDEPGKTDERAEDGTGAGAERDGFIHLERTDGSFRLPTAGVPAVSSDCQ